MPPIRKTAPRWGTLALRFAIVLLVLTAAAYFAASYALNQYLHGEAFRALLGEKTSQFLGVEGRYEPIERNGFSFYSNGYTAGKGRLLKHLKADQIRAEFEPAALFEGAWKVDGVQIQRVEAEVGAPVADPGVAVASPVSVPEPAAADFPSAPARPAAKTKSSWIPDRFELKQAKIEEASLAWKPPGHEGALSRSRIVLQPDNHDLVATGYGGTLAQAGLPVFKIDHFKIRYRHPSLYLTDSQLQIGEGELVNASGEADLGGGFDFIVKYSGIAIAPYLPEDWRAGIKGKANGEAHLTGSGSTIQSTGSLNLTGGQLEALPILEKIASFTRTRQFRQFTLQRADADYVWTPGKLTLTRINAESEGLISLSGSMTVENGIARGDFQLGVTPSSLKWLPGSRNRVFTQEHDGYAWTTLQVSGPLDRLNEDLSARLTAAAGEEIIEGVKGTIENGAKSLFDLLKSQVR